MTMNDGFLLGPEAFNKISGGIEHTVLWEVTRLNNQIRGTLAVDEGR